MESGRGAELDYNSHKAVRPPERAGGGGWEARGPPGTSSSRTAGAAAHAHSASRERQRGPPRGLRPSPPAGRGRRVTADSGAALKTKTFIGASYKKFPVIKCILQIIGERKRPHVWHARPRARPGRLSRQPGLRRGGGAGGGRRGSPLRAPGALKAKDVGPRAAAQAPPPPRDACSTEATRPVHRAPGACRGLAWPLPSWGGRGCGPSCPEAQPPRPGPPRAPRGRAGSGRRPGARQHRGKRGHVSVLEKRAPARGHYTSRGLGPAPSRVPGRRAWLSVRLQDSAALSEGPTGQRPSPGAVPAPPAQPCSGARAAVWVLTNVEK